MLTAYENGCLPASLLTKREAIAAQMLGGLCANEPAWQVTSLLVLAGVAVEQADALLSVLATSEAS